jgi:hypothetical protein
VLLPKKAEEKPLVILALDLLVAPLAAAPPSGKIPLIGVLRPVAADDPVWLK